MFTAPPSAYECMLWPVKFLALLGTIRRGMCFALFTSRAFLRDTEAAKLAKAALVNSRANFSYATLFVHSC